jgi:catechol 2,3-dioxygenase-like lactoylglutathione lyase family enzyme
MRVRLNSIVVDDQDKAVTFYTEKLGFVIKTDVPAGGARWITLVPPDEPDGPELALEPSGYEFATAFRRTLFEKGIPFTALASDDLHAEYESLKAKGVVFTSPPNTAPGFPPMAIFNDTCGNYIMMYEIAKQ